MDYLELTLENVEFNSTIEYLFNIINTYKLKNYTVLTDNGYIDLQSLEQLKSSIVSSSDGSFYFNVLDFNILDTTLNVVGLQVLKYSLKYDLNIDFQVGELIGKVSVIDLQKFASLLSVRLKALHYYCGFEPAYDQNTRLFTGNYIGPLIL